MTALEAVRKIMKERGCVIVGVRGGRFPDPGDILDDFCHREIPGHALKVTGYAKRSDWDAQRIALFGPKYKDPNDRESQQRFYTTVLIPAPDASEASPAEEPREGLPGGKNAR